MKHGKKDSLKKVDDLKFIPLDIKEPFKLDIASLLPLGNLETFKLDNLSKGIKLNLPPLIFNTQAQLPEITIPDSKTPVMKYPDNVPNLEKDDLTSQDSPNANSPKNIESEQLEYPSETSSDELYSYNKTTVRYNFDDTPINPIDILRNFDLLDEIDPNARIGYSKEDMDRIYDKILNDHPSLLATLKAYRVPYPIARLLIRKVVELTLHYSKR